jgi:NADPH-dependent 7-cyano-7-deazaguanine reductase QueF-like protein
MQSFFFNKTTATTKIAQFSGIEIDSFKTYINAFNSSIKRKCNAGGILCNKTIADLGSH